MLSTRGGGKENLKEDLLDVASQYEVSKKLSRLVQHGRNVVGVGGCCCKMITNTKKTIRSGDVDEQTPVLVVFCVLFVNLTTYHNYSRVVWYLVDL